MQQSSIKPRCEKVALASSPRDAVDSCFPHSGLQAHASHSFSAHSFNTNSWDVREELRLWELEEVKARAAQMEKTMRWWSDCTANWREKWSKVRAERNSAREEGRQLRIKLEMTVEELSALKKKQSLLLQKEASETNFIHDLELPTFADTSNSDRAQFQTALQTYDSIGQYLVKRQFPIEENTSSKEGIVVDAFHLNEEMKTSSDITDLFKCIGSGNCAVDPGLRLQAINLPSEEKGTKISALQIHLVEFQQTLWKEREIRAALEKEIKQMDSALSLWKRKYEELKRSKESNGNEFDIVHGQHAKGMEQISGDIKEESISQNNNEVICELESELERLQAENSSGWDNTELLETEKQGLERENRRLKVQLKEMEELLDKKHRLSANFQSPDVKTSQVELQEKNKVWCSWKCLFSYCVFPSDA
ncbi:coiled-coil domain-containing protein 102B [Fukomys damarensis]|uniref:Coiled-coil domain-containing protein 102B n=1 Tax=Fukomys damarensis TaxID=885580 RepID=A0A091ERL4_FUKDA|nr:coiled-coil domain-containing protein 102B [Fukomys damarensis]KFO38421.1 Coiled-coil domain-containing protein 102B [Fukomys damarensis]